MKTIIALLLCVLTLKLGAGELTQGYVFQDNTRINAAQLALLVNNAVINPLFYTDKAYQGSPVNGDVFLVYNAGSGTFHQITAQSLIYTNTAIISSQPTENPPSYAAFLFYDATNQLMYQTPLTNLASTLSSSIVVSNLSLYTTNGNQLPVYSNFNPASTNNQLMMIVYDTNGVPSSATLTNVFLQYQAFVYTNYTMPYVWRQVFKPWSIYGTNTYGFTNAWGYQTNFAITNLFLPSTNAPTLTDTDSIPVQSGAQLTNTTATLLALYQYMTNKNALPPYNLARVQFSGQTVTETFTNMNTLTGIITNQPDSAGWTTPIPVSFAGTLNQIVTTPQVTSNQVYFAEFTNSSPMTGYQLYPDFNSASARTNQILGVTVSATRQGNIYWMTNFTSFNADAIQRVSGTSLQTGVYLVFFRTPATPGTYYYVSGSAVSTSGSHAEVFGLGANNIVTTNQFQIVTVQDDGTFSASPLVHVLVNPQ